MKHLRLMSLCFGMLLPCLTINAQVTSPKNSGNAPKAKTVGNRSTETLATMKGAYSMTLQKVSVNNQDSVYDTQQLKIYTDKYFMYAHAIPGDSLAEYGIGTYSLQNGSIIERPLYTSSAENPRDTFTLQITKRKDGYSQVINFPPDSTGSTFVLTEDYRTVSRRMNTMLDGAWKMTRVVYYPKEGAPQENNAPVQFKVFQSGHYMWARTEIDSASQKPVSFFGYGTFEMPSPQKVRETTTHSSFRSLLVGRPVTLQVVFKGKDRYEQTIAWPDGERFVETYMRLQ